MKFVLTLFVGAFLASCAALPTLTFVSGNATDGGPETDASVPFPDASGTTDGKTPSDPGRSDAGPTDNTGMPLDGSSPDSGPPLDGGAPDSGPADDANTPPVTCNLPAGAAMCCASVPCTDHDGLCDAGDTCTLCEKACKGNGAKAICCANGSTVQCVKTPSDC
jgi:hypothetical protein